MTTNDLPKAYSKEEFLSLPKEERLAIHNQIGDIWKAAGTSEELATLEANDKKIIMFIESCPTGLQLNPQLDPATEAARIKAYNLYKEMNEITANINDRLPPYAAAMRQLVSSDEELITDFMLLTESS